MSKSLTRRATPFVLLGLAIPAGCSKPPSCPGWNVLVVVVDTLRADHLGCYGYPRDTSPRIDALAKESVLFERAEAQASWTLASTATILTGLYPFVHGMTKPSNGPLSPDAVLLAERLCDAGYATYGYSANNVVARASGFDQGFDRFENGPFSDADRTNATVIPWIDEAVSRGKPFFLYVHYFDPHHPYDDPARYAERFGGRPHEGTDSPGVVEQLMEGRPAGLTASEIEQLIAHYDGEIRYVDEKVGELLDAFRSRGLLDRTIVVFTSDHGEQFLEHGWIRHGSTLFEEETHVPLIVRIAGEPPRRVSARVECADVTPTVLDLLEMPLDPAFDGVSLRRWWRRARPDDLSFSETQHRFEIQDGEIVQQEILAIRKGRMKLMVREEEALLFDLVTDPGERHDLAASEPDVVRELRAEVQRWKRSGMRRTLRPVEFDPTDAQALVKRLKANGYLPDVELPRRKKSSRAGDARTDEPATNDVGKAPSHTDEGPPK